MCAFVRTIPGSFVMQTFKSGDWVERKKPEKQEKREKNLTKELHSVYLHNREPESRDWEEGK